MRIRVSVAVHPALAVLGRLKAPRVDAVLPRATYVRRPAAACPRRGVANAGRLPV